MIKAPTIAHRDPEEAAGEKYAPSQIGAFVLTKMKAAGPGVWGLGFFGFYTNPLWKMKASGVGV